MKSINDLNLYKVRKVLKDRLKKYFTGRLDAQIEIEKRKANEEFSLSANDYARVNVKISETSSNVEKFNFKKDLAERRLYELELIKASIEMALGILTMEEYQLLELSFSKEKYTIRQVAAKLLLAESTVANKRRKFLDKLINILGMADISFEEK